MKKILYIITQGEWGGAQRYIYDLATTLPKDTFSVAVAIGSDGPLFQKLHESNISTYKLKHLVREISPISDFRAYAEIKTLCKQLRPDIVHLNSSKVGAVGSIAARHAGVAKIIYTVHGFPYHEPISPWKQMLYKTVEQLTAPYKDIFICVSHYDMESAIQNSIGKPSQLTTIHNGIAPITFLDKEAARKSLNTPGDVFLIGVIANFYETKGLSYLIDALAMLKQYSFHCTIIGDGELREKLTAQIKQHSLEEHVTLAGVMENAAQYLKAFDLYVMPSVKEGFPYALLETAQAGIPTIASNVGGIPEVLRNKENGLLVKPKDSQQLADSISSLIINKEAAQQYATQLQNDFSDKFSLEEMRSKTLDAYSS